MKLIDADRLIEALEEEYQRLKPLLESGMVNDSIAEGFLHVEQIINWKMPQVNQWIPCKERLPKENEVVIISTIDGVIVAILTHDCIDKQYWELYNDISYSWELEDVIAWQPLPKPYEEK